MIPFCNYTYRKKRETIILIEITNLCIYKQFYVFTNLKLTETSRVHSQSRTKTLQYAAKIAKIEQFPRFLFCIDLKKRLLFP